MRTSSEPPPCDRRDPGLFGPGSATWRVAGETCVFLAAGRAALMQLAHPFVAQAIADWSVTLDAPIARFHATFRAVYAIVYGTHADAQAAADAVRRVHARIQGRLSDAVGRWPAGARYTAADPAAAAWVHATLMDGALVAHEAAGAAIPADVADAYIAEQVRFARLFGVPEDRHPPDRAALARAMAAARESGEIAVSPTARRIAEGLLAGVRVGPFRFAPQSYRRMTAALLPQGLRAPFGLEITAREEAKARRAMRRWGGVLRRAPAGVRYVGPHALALARVRGTRPSLVARASARVFTGGR